MYFPYLEPVCCSMSKSNCCFLTYIQISQEADKVVWYSHILKNFPQFAKTLCFSSVQFLSRVWLFATPWIAARQASLSITNSRSSLRLNVHRVSDAIQPSHPLSSPSPPAPNPSQHQSLFQWVNSSHEVAIKDTEFSSVKNVAGSLIGIALNL